MHLYEWAARWQIPLEAIAELQAINGMNGTPGHVANGKSEAFAQSQVMLEAAQKGLAVWRNNVGALKDETGRVVRYGLANDSSALNKVLKSSDLIGIRPVQIVPAHVGLTIGQFVAREIKAPGWHYSGTEREEAQLNFINYVNSRGGDAAFATGAGSL
jgi:hypothetical protein